MDWDAAFAALGWSIAVFGILSAIVLLMLISDASVWHPGRNTRLKWLMVIGAVGIAIVGIFLAAGFA